ncbi:MAG: ADP-forming succinate--CoA ligase subunit beta [Candidatus Binatia bacterium]
MNVHEYQGKAQLAAFGLSVPRGIVVDDPEKAASAVEELGSEVAVVKAQIHAGGRGAGALVTSAEEAGGLFHEHLAREGLPPHGMPGGVRLVRSAEEARAAVDGMIGSLLVTRQTGPLGRRVRQVLVEEGCDIARELYLSMLVDRAVGRPVMMASIEGGVEIERVAEETPEKILRVEIDPAVGLLDCQARRTAYWLELPAQSLAKAVTFMKQLSRAFTELDASLVEINPLVLTGDGDIVALDAKVSFDDNALYRHPEIAELRDENEEDSKETWAAKYDLSYIALDGNIGCMVNGAGLAMATMDIINHHGGSPANFCDVGGGATAEKVAEAFKIILSDDKVKAVFINIFGGIMQCDVLAAGVVEAARDVEVGVPLVVRLEGTNVEKGKAIIAESDLAIITAEDMADGAAKAVKAAGL